MTQVSEFIPAPLLELQPREGTRPHIAVEYPSLQTEDIAPDELRVALIDAGSRLPSVRSGRSAMNVPGEALSLDKELAKGKPEGFLHRLEFAIVRDEGSVQVNLDPDCGQIVLDRGWGVIHPLARYMAGALPPQSLIVFAPRNAGELATVSMIIEVAYVYAVGRIGDLILPDTAW